jgi:homoserine kinase
VTAAVAWRAPVPSGIVALIAAVAIGGTVAGFLAATPLLLVTTPVLAAGLAAAAAFGPRKPEWHREAFDALAQLPDGQARELLADLLRRAEAVPAVAHAGTLVAAACGAARQLAALELHGDAPMAKRGRALLSQRLQDASAALTRWQAAQGAGESLGELARELNEESRYQEEAAHEVEALLT